MISSKNTSGDRADKKRTLMEGTVTQSHRDDNSQAPPLLPSPTPQSYTTGGGSGGGDTTSQSLDSCFSLKIRPKNGNQPLITGPSQVGE